MVFHIIVGVISIMANVRRYVEYSSPTVGGVGAAFAPHIAWLKHEFTKSSSECCRLSRKRLCQRVLHISHVRARSIFSKHASGFVKEPVIPDKFLNLFF